MKAVVFICLLSLSLSLSQPTAQADVKPNQQPPAQANKASPPAQVKTENTEKSPAPVGPYNATTVVVITTESSKNTAQPSEASAAHPTEANAAAAAAKSNETKPLDNKTDKNEKKDGTPKPNESKPFVPAKNATETKVKPANDTKPAENDKKPEKTTPQPEPTKPEVAKDATEKPTLQARGFDGASFIGGIILTLGLLAIGFMGFKYYKNQTERNYHTL